MLAAHREIQQWVKQRYGTKYRVRSEDGDGKNQLPDSERHWYEPDVVVRDQSKNIIYIIEVENDPVRKALVGAAILADASITELKQTVKPRLIFVIYSENGIKQIHNFRDKMKIAQPYCTNIASLEVYSEAEFNKLEL